VSVFLVATYDTDYLLLDGEQLPRALKTLQNAGHNVRSSSD
jgi:hypothetical protein